MGGKIEGNYQSMKPYKVYYYDSLSKTYEKINVNKDSWSIRKIKGSKTYWKFRHRFKLDNVAFDEKGTLIKNQSGQYIGIDNISVTNLKKDPEQDPYSVLYTFTFNSSCGKKTPQLVYTASEIGSAPIPNIKGSKRYDSAVWKSKLYKI